MELFSSQVFISLVFIYTFFTTILNLIRFYLNDVPLSYKNKNFYMVDIIINVFVCLWAFYLCFYPLYLPF